MAEQKDYNRGFKLAALARMAAGENVAALARELGIKRKRLYLWREAYRFEGEAGLRTRGRPPGGHSPPSRPPNALVEPGHKSAPPPDASALELSSAQRRIADLERKIGQQELALDFFQQALRRVGVKARASGGNGGTDSTK